jgi:hypothetical protein
MDLLSLDEWTGVTTKSNQSHKGFTAHVPKNTLKVVCWNCGEVGHGIPQCPKPANPERIKAKRKAFREHKKKE